MSMRSVSGFVALLSLGLFLGGCAASQSVGELGTPYPIEGQRAGDDAALKTPGTTLITDQAGLAALGSNLGGLEADFDRESVVVVTMGKQATAGYWTRITGIQLVGNTLYVQATRNRPAEGAGAAVQVSHAYAAVAIEKVPAGTNVVPENTSVTGEPTPEN